MDFKTNDGVVNIFRNLNCLGMDNCYFVTFRDTNSEAFKYGAFGAVGGALGAAAAFSSGMVEGMKNYDGLLINQTENGLGIIPLVTQGVQLILNPDKMVAEPNRFFFIPNQYIASIIVKKFNIFNKKTQKVRIKLTDGTEFKLLAHVSEKNISYQESNFAKFMNKYSK